MAPTQKKQKTEHTLYSGSQDLGCQYEAAVIGRHGCRIRGLCAQVKAAARNLIPVRGSIWVRAGIARGSGKLSVTVTLKTKARVVEFNQAKLAAVTKAHIASCVAGAISERDAAKQSFNEREQQRISRQGRGGAGGARGAGGWAAVPEFEHKLDRCEKRAKDRRRDKGGKGSGKTKGADKAEKAAKKAAKGTKAGDSEAVVDDALFVKDSGRGSHNRKVSNYRGTQFAFCGQFKELSQQQNAMDCAAAC